MSNRDQHTLANAILSQALRDLQSRSARQRAEARHFLRPSPSLLVFCSLAGLRATHVLSVVRGASR